MSIKPLMPRAPESRCHTGFALQYVGVCILVMISGVSSSAIDLYPSSGGQCRQHPGSSAPASTFVTGCSDGAVVGCCNATYAANLQQHVTQKISGGFHGGCPKCVPNLRFLWCAAMCTSTSNTSVVNVTSCAQGSQLCGGDTSAARNRIEITVCQDFSDRLFELCKYARISNRGTDRISSIFPTASQFMESAVGCSLQLSSPGVSACASSLPYIVFKRAATSSEGCVNPNTQIPEATGTCPAIQGAPASSLLSGANLFVVFASCLLSFLASFSV